MNLTFPPPLRPGDKVRIIAPSGQFRRERMDPGVDVLRAAGLVPEYDDGVFATERFFAGDDSRRLAELQSAIADPHVRAIWAARGGYGAARLLPLLALAPIQQANKWLVGFSDITALHGAWARAGLGSMHGAVISNVATWDPIGRARLFDRMFGRAANQTFQGQSVLGDTPVEAPIWGGNLTVLTSLVGTGYLPDLRGTILLIEDVGERPYRLDRYITQLRQGGALDGVLGVAIGQLTECTEKEVDYTAVDVLRDVLYDLHIPVVAGLPVGHENTSQPVLLGSNAVLDPTAGTLRLDNVDYGQKSV